VSDLNTEVDGVLVRSWIAYQGPSIRGTLANRLSLQKQGRKTLDLLDPYTMKYVSVATHFDDDFMRFAKRLPPRLSADAMLVRVLQFTAERSSQFGHVLVPKERWGPVVLSADWQDISRGDGILVHNAMIEARIIVPASREALLERMKDVLSLVKYEPVLNTSGYVTGYAPRSTPQDNTKDASRYVPPASASSPALLELPPQPPSVPDGGGPAVASSNGHGGERPATDTDRAVVDAILTKQAAFFGPASAQPPVSVAACEARKRLRAGQWSDHEVRVFLLEHQPNFLDLAVEVRSRARKEARDARRGGAIPTFDEAGT
jgi:hypothetical protein